MTMLFQQQRCRRMQADHNQANMYPWERVSEIRSTKQPSKYVKIQVVHLLVQSLWAANLPRYCFRQDCLLAADCA